MKVKSQSEVAQSCPTPRDPMDCSLPGSSIHGIFQARVLEWGAIAFSESGYRKNITQHKKAIYDKSTTNIIFNDEKWKASPLKNQEQDKDSHSYHSYSTQYWKSSSTAIRQEKEIKGIQVGKEEVKLTICG